MGQAKPTVKEFLRVLFGEDWVRVWIARGAGDPKNNPGLFAGAGFAPKALPDWFLDGSEQILVENGFYAVGVMRDDAARRSAEFFIGSPILMLDDIGSKVDPERVLAVMGSPATAEIRTSWVSEQWIYRLPETITDPARYARLLRNVSTRLGLSDEGGQNVVRYARLPWTINYKEEHRRGLTFPTAELIEWRPLEEMDPLTLEMLEAVDTTPGVVATGDRFSGRLDQRDSWLMALEKLGWVKGDGRKTGVVDIECPFVEGHTTGAETTGYLGTGRFKCHHGHCQEKTDQDFQTRVCEALVDQGVLSGPGVVAKTGLGWIAGEMFALAPLDKSEKAVLKDRGRMLRRDVLDRFVYVKGLDVFADLVTGELLPEKAFQVSVRHAVDPWLRGANSATAVFHRERGRTVDTVSYLPGEDRFVLLDNGLSAFNTWAPSGLVLPAPLSVTDMDVKPWLDHVELILPDPRVREIALDFMAWVLGKPGCKVNWCWVLVGEQGIGKDMLVWPLVEALGRWNVSQPTADDLAGSFNASFVQVQLAIFQELHSYERVTLYEKLKNLVAAPPHEIRVNQKFQKPYTIPNLLNTMALTNHDDALPLAAGDRRFWVTTSPAQPQGEGYYSGLAGWLVGSGGFGLVARWLVDRALAPGAFGSSGFSSTKCPADLDGSKQVMTQGGASLVARWVVDQLSPGGVFGGRTVISAQEIVEHVLANRGGVSKAVLDTVSDKKVVEGLRLAGAKKLRGGLQVRTRAGRRRLWVVGGASVSLLDQLTESQLDDKIAEEKLGDKFKDNAPRNI